jgi:hypothetical protein
MQTVRFKGFHGMYYVSYKNTKVALIVKINKNKWLCYAFAPIFKNKELSFKSLKDAKRYMRIRLNKFYVAQKHLIKMTEKGVTRVINAKDKIIELFRDIGKRE